MVQAIQPLKKQNTYQMPEEEVDDDAERSEHVESRVFEYVEEVYSGPEWDEGEKNESFERIRLGSEDL